MATAGSIVIDLKMMTGAFSSDTQRAEKSLNELQKTAKQAGAVLGTALTVAGGALIAITKNAINNADAMRDMSIRLGTSTETLSAFSYAATQTGTDIDTLGKGMKVLSKNMADSLNPSSEQAQIFKALGVQVTDANGKLKDLSVIVPEIADKFALLEDGTTKAALAQKLFGKAGLDLTEFMNSGAQGLDDFTKRARELGIVIGQDTADAADEFNDKLGDARALVGGLGLALAKELLPDLNRLIGGFTEGGTAGDKLAETAKTIADAIRGVGSVVQFVAVYFKAFGDVIEGATMGFVGFAEAARGVINLDWDRIKNGMMVAQQGADLAYYGEDKASKINPGAYGDAKKPSFDIITPESLFKEDARLAKEMRARRAEAERLSKLAFGDTPKPAKTPKGGSRKAQFSDEEKDVKRLLESYERLSEGLDERIALFGKEGEAVKVRYDIEHGELAKLAPAQQADLIAKAERLDQMNEELDLQRQLDEADKRRLDNFTELGMSSDQQEVWNNLKDAGVTADSAWGKQIVESTKALQAQRDAMDDQIAVMDEIRGAGADLFVDFASGEGAINSLGDAWDRVHKKLLHMIAENLMDQLFGKQGDPAGGSTGGWMSGIMGRLFDGGSAPAADSGGGGSGAGFWANLIGSIFAGGRAGGGDVFDNHAYLIGEQGPEMFVPRTAGTVLTAAATAAVTRGGSLGNLQQNFYTMGIETRRTQERKAQLSGREAQRAMARTGR